MKLLSLTIWFFPKLNIFILFNYYVINYCVMWYVDWCNCTVFLYIQIWNKTKLCEWFKQYFYICQNESNCFEDVTGFTYVRCCYYVLFWYCSPLNISGRSPETFCSNITESRCGVTVGMTKWPWCPGYTVGYSVSSGVHGWTFTCIY